MEEIQYIGEHLLPGAIGRFAMILAFVSSLLAATAYFFGTQRRALEEAKTWNNLGRGAFFVHGMSIFSVFGILFYMMINQYYEYAYVQAHVSDDLPMRYIFSAFWEGQEGSFLLWMFWHIILGFILMVKAKSWEAPVMSIISLTQTVITTMILGLFIYLGETEIKIGSSPLLLLRDTIDAPIFASADYVRLLKGDGLNPLLQNYWMTIHPPTLFLGFASTLVPFAYAIAGLWTGRHREWLQPVLPWALFSGFILGLGILMGGAWAYEALSFGGYWAWDPVENSSLVPWIVLVAGIHGNLIARSTGHSIRSTYIFYLLTFLGIVYSTTLTRSGVLGDTSVHAFTEMGLEAQLLFFIFLFSFISIFAFAKSFKAIPAPAKEESVKSKEFWMFIGTLVLFFSAILITFTTSIPVYRKVAELFGTELNITSPLEPVAHYNKYQLWIAVFVGLLSGVAQYLRYKEFNWSKYRSRFLKHTLITLGITAVISFLTSLWITINTVPYFLLLFSAIFAIVANVDYLFSVLKGNMKMAGSVLSHVGFGVMIVGIMASGIEKEFISSNPPAQRKLIEEELLLKNVLLFKDMPMYMKGYQVTYEKDTIEGFIRTYTIDFKKLDENGNVEEQFKVYPNIQYNNDFTTLAARNPNTKRYLHKDIFTHVANLPAAEVDAEARKAKEDSLNYKMHLPEVGQVFNIVDSSRNVNYRAVVESINRNATHPDYEAQPNDIPLGINLAINDTRFGKDTLYRVAPMVVLRGNLLYTYPEQINDLNMKVRLNESVFDEVYTPERSTELQ